MALDHLVKERYPRFIDALRDMDDALCMIHLFAAMPSQGRITVGKFHRANCFVFLLHMLLGLLTPLTIAHVTSSEHSALCSQLVRHWQYYVAKSRSLHKVSYILLRALNKLPPLSPETQLTCNCANTSLAAHTTAHNALIRFVRLNLTIHTYTTCTEQVFVSVKGVYFQAEVMGEPITWLVPHPFTQTVPREVIPYLQCDVFSICLFSTD
jgi:hypothetical protein